MYDTEIGMKKMEIRIEAKEKEVEEERQVVSRIDTGTSETKVVLANRVQSRGPDKEWSRPEKSLKEAIRSGGIHKSMRDQSWLKASSARDCG